MDRSLSVLTDREGRSVQSPSVLLPPLHSLDYVVVNGGCVFPWYMTHSHNEGKHAIGGMSLTLFIVTRNDHRELLCHWIVYNLVKGCGQTPKSVKTRVLEWEGEGGPSENKIFKSDNKKITFLIHSDWMCTSLLVAIRSLASLAKQNDTFKKPPKKPWIEEVKQ